MPFVPLVPYAASSPSLASASGCLRPLRAALLAGSLLVASLAQVSTPALAAPAAKCEIPAAVAAASTPVAGTPAATPLPLSDATAVPPASAATATASTPLETELGAVANALAACLSSGNARGVTSLVTESWLGNLFGSDDDIPQEQYLEIAAVLDVIPVRILSLGDARQTGRTATAEVESVVGNQLQRTTWTFVEAPAGDRTPGQITWRVDREQNLAVTPPKDAKSLDVTLRENSLTIADPITDATDVVLRGINDGVEDHEMLVVRLASGFTVADLLRQFGPGFPGEVEWIGQATLPAGGSGDLVLTGLESGTYTVLCLLTAADGTPHAALGEVATFEVE